jgi:diguanylate cyclase (GGDEF)-like protein/PAS domain S-box-containing protein
LEKSKNLKILSFVTVTYLLFLVLTIYFFYNEKEQRENSISAEELKKSDLELYTILEDFEHKLISQLTIKVIQNNDVVDTFKNVAKATTPEELDRERKKLYNSFKDTFKSLKIDGIDILHFHLPNSISFLRMHNPKAFGDDLSSFRHSINVAQETGKYVYGYEIGIHRGAFRNVIPFFDRQKLIGSLEISYCETNLLKFSKRIANDHSYGFILDKEYVKETVIDTSIYKKSKINDNFLLLNIQEENILDSSISKEVKTEELLEYKAFSKIIYKKSKHHIVSFIPINGINGKKVGYFIKYRRTEILSQANEDAVMKIFTTTLFISLFYIFIIQHILYFRKESFHKNYLDAIFNTQENMIIITEGRKLSDGNKQFLKFFDFNSIEEFKEKHDCICEFMEIIQHREYIYKDKFGNNWIDTIRQNPEINWKAEILREERRHVFSIKVTYMNFDHKKRSVVSFSDITDIIEYQENLQQEIENRVREIKIQKYELQKYKNLVDENVITSSTDTKGFITDVSQAFIEISGYTKEELIGTNHNIVRHPENPSEIYKEMWDTIESGKTWKGEIRNIDSHGDDYWVIASVYPKFDYENTNKIVGYTAIRQDITDKKKIEELSIRDALTGLYNRRFFDSQIVKEMKTAILHGESFSFIIADIDNFKKYNDNYGHQKGDIVLKAVSRLLQRNFSCKTCFVFRLGGEEFGMIFRGLSRDEALELVQKGCKNLEERQLQHEYNLNYGVITGSFGFVFKQVLQKDISDDDLYRIADQALYRAKSLGRNRVEFIEI